MLDELCGVTIWAQEARQPSLVDFMPMILGLLVLFFFVVVRPQKREQAQRESMLSGLKKNDRVITTGGIYGVVTSVQPADNEITLRIDEATNVKIRVTFSAIARVLNDETNTKSEKKEAS